VPSDSVVYIFYIPGINALPELSNTLISWGKTTGKNACVGILSGDAPDYKNIVSYFNVKKSPAAVISAAHAFASDNEKASSTAYSRIDNLRLMSNQAEINECMQEIYNLFIQNKVKEAISTAKKESFKENLKFYLGKLSYAAGKAINEFFKTHDVNTDIFKGKIVITPSPKPSTPDASPVSGEKKQKN
jgi:hypothetical protein